MWRISNTTFKYKMFNINVLLHWYVFLIYYENVKHHAKVSWVAVLTNTNMHLWPVSVTFLILEAKLASWNCLRGVLCFLGLQDYIAALWKIEFEFPHTPVFCHTKTSQFYCFKMCMTMWNLNMYVNDFVKHVEKC